MSHHPTKSPAYAASKAGLEGLTISLSKQLSDKKIRLNLVSPGPIKTKMISSHSKNRLRELQNKISLKRLGNPDEVANVVCFLIDDKSAYINGQIIKVDGGFF